MSRTDRPERSLVPRRGHGWTPGLARWVAIGPWMACGLVLLAALCAQGQDPQDKPSDASAAAAETDAEKAVVDTKQKSVGLEERYKDPRVDAVLANSFPELFQNARKTTKGENDRMLASARESGGDLRSIPTYVRAQLAQLTSHRNIDAMLQPAGVPDANRAVNAIEEAGANLLNPLLEANAAKNTAFRTEFTKALVKDAPEVLKNHLYARLMLMVALSRSQDPAALDLFTKLLDDPNQILSVKLLAAVGLANIGGSGKVDVVPAEAAKAARSLVGFLQTEKSAFWPARLRAAEALGSLRQAETTVRSPRADVADELLTILSSPDERPQVRAQAAWSLGMLRPTAQVSRYNFGLIAYHMGRAVAEIGEKIVEVSKDSDAGGRRLADALVEIMLGFEGDQAIRGAGLLRNEHSNLGAYRAAARTIADRSKAVAVAAVDLGNAPKARKDAARQALSSQIEELRSTLAANEPTDRSIYPDGPQFTDAVAAEAEGGQEGSSR